jgi:signal transduction histidine kinase
MTLATDRQDAARRRRPALPPALRIPTAAGAVVFAVAVVTTQIALHVTNRQADRQLELLGQVYLDGIASSVRGGLESGDLAYTTERLARAFIEQRGIAERGLFAFAADGRLIARHGDEALSEAEAAALPPNGWRLDDDKSTAWASRTVRGAEGEIGRVVAALDIGPILAARSRLAWMVVAVDLTLAGLCALLTWFVLYRLGQPLRVLVAQLSAGERRAPARVPDAVLARADPASAKVILAYNRMVEGVRERERLAAELADREQAAALGRLAATIAHEVRNPLGGLATTVSTLRRFGADPAVREESLDFLDRGIAALERIVTSTLDFYRPEEDRQLTRRDLEDMAVLLRPAAQRRGVALALELDLPEGEVAPGASALRQVLLNLLLNACEATPPGGTVGLRVWREAEELLCEISDSGPGLDAAQATRLTGQDGAPPGRARGLGLGVVVGLLGSLDARASVTERPSGGTVIRLAAPLRARSAAAETPA